MKQRAATLVAVALCIACGPTAPVADAGSDAAPDPDAPDAPGDPDAPPATLRAEAGPSLRALVGEEVVLDASASTGAVEYEWWPGDGRRLLRSADPVARVTFAEPGRYRADLIVYDAVGTSRTDVTTVTVTHASVFAPRQSSTVAVTGFRDASTGLGLVAVVSPDSDEVVLVADDPATGLGAGVPTRVAVCEHPRTVASFDARRIVVTCPDDDALAVVEVRTGAVVRVDLRYGARPFGVVSVDDGRVAVSLSGTGELAIVEDLGAGPVVTWTWPAIQDARALALLPDGRVVVSRWRSPDTGGELVAVDLETGARTPIVLAVDPQIASDTEIGGVPSYLESLAVSPDGTRLAVAGLQASLAEGTFRSGRALRFDTALRATICFVDVATLTETFERRRQLDNRAFVGAVTFSTRGDFLFVATRGNRTVERYDVLRDVMAGTVQDVGYALSGLAVRDGDWLYVDAFLSRELVAFDTSALGDAVETARVVTVAAEPLAADVFRGAQLFADSADTRIAADGYMACAHCHLDGLDDHRTWDFTDRGEGLRNTIEIVGRAGDGHGPIHWSANFDEIQDFENDMRNAFGGTGLLTDADWATHSMTLGTTKAGLSADLDALAAYVGTLDTFLRSPYRNADGTLPTAAVRGRASFLRADLGCTTCHSGPGLTDSAFSAPGAPVLHDVGTLDPGSGMRLGGSLPGIDTPTLHGVFGTAPYLHDGSAATLREVFTIRSAGDWHGRTGLLTPAEMDDLLAYLLCLDGTVDP